MFRTTIRETPFTTEGANEYWPRITGSTYSNGDVSFLATLRALIGPRMPADAVLTLRFANFDSSEMGAYAPAFKNEEDTLRVVGLTGGEDDTTAGLAVLDGIFDTDSGFKKSEIITTFFQKFCRVACYMNRDKKTTVLFVERPDIRIHHFLQCSIPALLPWYYNASDGLSEDEMALVCSLKETTSAQYTDALNRLIELYDLRSITIRKLLSGYETRGQEAQLEMLKGNLESYNNRIEEAKHNIADLLANRDDIITRYTGLRKRIAEKSGENELMEYFLSCDTLDLVSVNSSSFTFIVRAYLDYFDEDAAESVILNEDWYDDNTGDFDTEDAQKLLTEVYLSEHPRLKIKTCAVFTVETGRRTRAISGWDYGSKYKNYLPNPHIYHYGCIGSQAERLLLTLSEKADDLGCVSQCMASARNINFTDGIVAREFLKDVFENDARCFETPEGKVLTASEAIKWLNEQE